MREIKFRAWDGIEMFTPKAIVNAKDYGSGEYYKNGGFYCAKLWYEYEIMDIESDIVLMQYIGLKDKNGKEIYEGDIVKTFSPTKGWIVGEVAYINNGIDVLGYAVKKSDNEFFYIYGNDEIEVIGNIFENKELLEVENDS